MLLSYKGVRTLFMYLEYSSVKGKLKGIIKSVLYVWDKDTGVKEGSTRARGVPPFTHRVLELNRKKLCKDSVWDNWKTLGATW